MPAGGQSRKLADHIWFTHQRPGGKNLEEGKSINLESFSPIHTSSGKASCPKNTITFPNSATHWEPCVRNKPMGEHVSFKQPQKSRKLTHIGHWRNPALVRIHMEVMQTFKCIQAGFSVSQWSPSQKDTLRRASLLWEFRAGVFTCFYLKLSQNYCLLKLGNETYTQRELGQICIPQLGCWWANLQEKVRIKNYFCFSN